jgi:tartrate dehydratase beta subunit/fumarate hydratase class I family protein
MSGRRRPAGAPDWGGGPTTSFRMDAYAPRLMEAGMRGMIGKGPRSQEVIAAMRNGAVFTSEQQAEQVRFYLGHQTGGGYCL